MKHTKINYTKEHKTRTAITGNMGTTCNSSNTRNIVIAMMLIFLVAATVFITACNQTATIATTPTGKIIAQQNEPINEQTKNPLKIGFISPMSGNAAVYGEYARRAFALGVDEYNANHKQQIQVIYEDGKCSPVDAVSAANKLITIDHVHALMTFCTGETNAVSPIAESNNVILLTSGTTGPNIRTGKYLFRNIGSVSTGLYDLSQLAYGADEKIALISENTDYATSTKNDFKKKFASVGGSIAFDESFDAKSADFRTIIAKLKNDNIKTVFVVVQTLDNSALLFKQMKEMDYHPLIFATEAAISTNALDKYFEEGYGEIIEGAVFAQPYFDSENPKAKQLLDSYAAKYNSTKGPVSENYLATHYDAAYLLGEAYANTDGSPDAMSTYLLGLQNWQGAVGNFSFTETGDAHVAVKIYVVADGKIVEQ